MWSVAGRDTVSWNLEFGQAVERKGWKTGSSQLMETGHWGSQGNKYPSSIFFSLVCYLACLLAKAKWKSVSAVMLVAGESGSTFDVQQKPPSRMFWRVTDSLGMWDTWIQILGRLREEDCKFGVYLSHAVRLWLIFFMYVCFIDKDKSNHMCVHTPISSQKTSPQQTMNDFQILLWDVSLVYTVQSSIFLCQNVQNELSTEAFGWTLEKWNIVQRINFMAIHKIQQIFIEFFLCSQDCGHLWVVIEVIVTDVYVEFRHR